MSIVTNIITPIVQLMAYVFMGGGLIFIIYKFIKTVNPDIRWTFKYKIFRRKFKENDVAWCMDALERGMNEIEIKKFLLIKGKSVKRTDEMIYIFQKIQKKLKGGENNDGKFGRSDEKIEKIEKIKRR